MYRKSKPNMGDVNANSKIKNLFVSYHSILRHHGFVWFLEEIWNNAVGHSLFAIKLISLKEILSQAIDLSPHFLKKGFDLFKYQTIRQAEAFQLVYNRVRKKLNSDTKARSGNKHDDQSSSGGSYKNVSAKNGKWKRSSTLSPLPALKNDLTPYMSDYQATISEEGKGLLRLEAEEKANTRRAKSTCARKTCGKPKRNKKRPQTDLTTSLNSIQVHSLSKLLL